MLLNPCYSDRSSHKRWSVPEVIVVKWQCGAFCTNTILMPPVTDDRHLAHTFLSYPIAKHIFYAGKFLAETSNFASCLYDHYSPPFALIITPCLQSYWLTLQLTCLLVSTLYITINIVRGRLKGIY